MGFIIIFWGVLFPFVISSFDVECYLHIDIKI